MLNQGLKNPRVYSGSIKLFSSFMLLLGVCCAQSVPVEVKQAIVASIKASDSPTADDPQGGHHEEGGIWGLTTADKLIVIPAKTGKSLLRCKGIVTIYPGDAADPTLDENLETILGEWHIHPLGTMEDGKCWFVQEPSPEDLEVADDGINLEVGARDKIVYFYDHKGVTNKVDLKDFLAEQQKDETVSSIDLGDDVFSRMFDSGISAMQKIEDDSYLRWLYEQDRENIRRAQNCT